MAKKLTVVTHNVREFGRIDKLKVEDWATEWTNQQIQYWGSKGNEGKIDQPELQFTEWAKETHKIINVPQIPEFAKRFVQFVNNVPH